MAAKTRRDGRVVEGGGLENRFPVYPERGFESPSLRTFPAAPTTAPFFLGGEGGKY
jgi:hypothetical protein